VIIVNESYDMMFGEEFSLCGKDNIRSYISEICRSGAKSDLYNDRSVNDNIVVFDDKMVEYLPQDKSFRMEIANRIDHLCMTNDLYAYSIGKNLKRCTVDFQQPTLSAFNDTMRELFFALLDTMCSNADILPIAAVTHDDEENRLAHFHLLYVNQTGYELVEII